MPIGTLNDSCRISTPRIAATAGFQMEYASGEQKDFTYWLKAGFAFTLPMLGIGIILIVVLIALFINHPA